MSDKKYLTTKEVAKLLGVTTSAIEKWRSTKTGPQIPYVPVGRRMVRYDEDVVREYLANAGRP